VRGFLSDLTRRLFPMPMVEVKGSKDVDVCLMRKQGQLRVNLVNTSGPHQTAPIQETIQPVGPLAVTLRLPSKPAKLTLEPGAQPLAFEYRDGEAKLTVSSLDIHRVIVVERDPLRTLSRFDFWQRLAWSLFARRMACRSIAACRTGGRRRAATWAYDWLKGSLEAFRFSAEL